MRGLALLAEHGNGPGITRTLEKAVDMASAQSEPSMDDILASIRRIISEEDDAPEAGNGRLHTLHLSEDDAVDADSAQAAPAAAEPVPGSVLDNAKSAPNEAAVESAVSEAAAWADSSAPTLTSSQAVDAATAALAAVRNLDPVGDVARGADDADPLDSYTPPTPASPTPAALPNGASTVGAGSVAASSAAVEAAVAQAAEGATPQQRAALEELVSAHAAREAAESFGALQENVRISSSSGNTIEDVVTAMLKPMVKTWLDTNLPRIVEEKVEEEVRRIARRR